MNDKDRKEEERLSAIRRRARELEQGAAGRPSGTERPRRGPVVSTWRSAGTPGASMGAGYPGMMGGYPGYVGSRTPVGMPFEPGHPGWAGPMQAREGEWGGERERWSPRAQVLERGGHMIARVELPGLEREDVEVHVEEDRLIVEGERPDDRPPEERAQSRGEPRYGRFRREFPLPYPVDVSDVKARFRNGLLEVVVPQPSREERRKVIKVET